MERSRRSSDSDRVLEGLASLVTERLGLELDARALEKLRDIAERQPGKLGYSDPGSYLARLRSDRTGGPAWDPIIEALTVTEGYFFRDEGQFAALQRWVCPDLWRAAEKRGGLHLWSAGCGKGEEAYSLAILFMEQAGEQAPPLRLVGTDLNREAVEAARRGVYREWSFRRTEPERRRRWFRREDGGWRVIEPVRQVVDFHQLNLLEDGRTLAPPDGFDLVVCRNVLIYLTHEAQRRLLAILCQSLRPGGYLVTGHNELFGLNLHGLVPRLLPEALVYYRESAGPYPVRRAAVSPPRVPAHPAAGRRALPPRRVARERRQEPPPRGRPSASDRPRPLAEAWSLADAGRLEEAERRVRGDLEAGVQDPAAFFLLAYLEGQAGRTREAKAHLRRTLYLEPDFIPAYVEFAALYEREGRDQAAQRIRREALRRLSALPEEAPIEPYDSVTAGRLSEYLRHLEHADGGR